RQRGEGGKRGIARIGQPFRARERPRRVGRVALGDVHPREMLQPGRELGLELEDFFQGCYGLAACTPDQGAAVQQLVAPAKLAEQEILPAVRECPERVQAWSSWKLRGPDQGLVILREFGDMRAVAGVVRCVVLVVEPATDPGVAPVADPAGLVERRGSGVGAPRVTPMSPREGALSA